MVLDLPTPEGCKAELTSVAGYMVHTENTPTYMVTSQGTNQARRRTTTLIETQCWAMKK